MEDPLFYHQKLDAYSHLVRHDGQHSCSGGDEDGLEPTRPSLHRSLPTSDHALGRVMAYCFWPPDWCDRSAVRQPHRFRLYTAPFRDSREARASRLPGLHAPSHARPLFRPSMRVVVNAGAGRTYDSCIISTSATGREQGS